MVNCDSPRSGRRSGLSGVGTTGGCKERLTALFAPESFFGMKYIFADTARRCIGDSRSSRLLARVAPQDQCHEPRPIELTSGNFVAQNSRKVHFEKTASPPLMRKILVGRAGLEPATPCVSFPCIRIAIVFCRPRFLGATAVSIHRDVPPRVGHFWCCWRRC